MSRKAILIVVSLLLLAALPAYPWGSITHWYLGEEVEVGLGAYCNWPDWLDPGNYENEQKPAIWCHEMGAFPRYTASPNLPFAHSLFILAAQKMKGFDGWGKTTFEEANPTAKGFALHSLMDDPVHYNLFPFPYTTALAEVHSARERAVECIIFYKHIFGPLDISYNPTEVPPENGLYDLLYPGSGWNADEPADVAAAAACVDSLADWIVYEPSSADLVRVALACAWKIRKEMKSASIPKPDSMPDGLPYEEANWSSARIREKYELIGENIKAMAGSFTWAEYYDAVQEMYGHDFNGHDLDWYLAKSLELCGSESGSRRDEILVPTPR